MWEYIAVLLIGFWLGIAIFLYVSCYWLDEILDLPSRGASSPTPSASSAHAQLKRLVARVVEEAAALPALAQYAREPPRTPSVENTTYEDLLATAILNKVIERYQNESGSGGRSSGIHSASASPTPSERSSPRSQRIRDHTPPLEEEDEDGSDWEGDALEGALELPRRVPFPEFGGDIVHNNENDERDFDEVSGSDIQAVDGSWEENWLFQRKKIKAMQSVPVPMLVPNSNTDYRALIGDRDAEDTTDLSDNASENGDEEIEYKSDVKRILDSKHVIGGKSKVDDVLDFEPDSLTIIDDINEFDNNNRTVVEAQNDEINDENIPRVDTVNQNVKNNSVIYVSADTGPLKKAEFALSEEIHRTLTNGLKEDLGNVHPKEIGSDEVDSYRKTTDYRNNTMNGHEREGEYEETVTLPVQRYADSLRRKHFEEPSLQNQITSKNIIEEDLIPGSIADRERKKWLNYVEMPNNPYSPEAIQKRLSAKSTSSLFDSLTRSTDSEEPPVTIKKMEKFNNSKSMENLKGKSPTALTVSTSQIELDDHRSDSTSPKILKDVLAEEVPQYKRYGRDYYIKEAKLSSGGRRRGNFSDTSSVSSMNKSTSLDNFDTEFASTGLLIQQFNTIASSQAYTKFAGKDPPPTKLIIPDNRNDDNNNEQEYKENDNVDEQTLFSATPAIVDDETEKKFDEILQSNYDTESLTIDIESKSDTTSERSPNNASIVSNSSFDDSIKIYNVRTGEIVQCKPDSLSERYEASATVARDKISTPPPPVPVDDASREDEFDSVPVIIEEILSENQLETIEEAAEIQLQLPKVKELARKFVSMDSLNGTEPPTTKTNRKKSIENILNSLNERPSNKQAYMHSLTARSISKQFREELKLSMSTPIKTPGGTNEVPEGIEEVVKESSRPGSPLPEPGTIKTKLAFFESLKSRFSR